MRRQSQVIVRREVNNLLAVEGANRCLFVIEDAEFEVRALGFQLLELISQVGKRVAAGCRHSSSRLSRGSVRVSPSLDLIWPVHSAPTSLHSGTRGSCWPLRSSAFPWLFRNLSSKC